ncbi:MAG: hypothetical protein NC203_01280 [Firmicutes bacterium]|nr:hypothetical protein [[Eubacterium] siraeum]MCM1486973.1 hypothetical protein [Bacillota bacterium]
MAEQKFFTYKGLPLVRKGNEIYYGNMSDETVAYLKIMSTEKVNGLEVADRIKVVLMLTQTEGIDAGDIMKKTCERSGLYEALDVAYIWLERDKKNVS